MTPPGALESAAKMISFFSRLLSAWGSVIRPVSAEQMPAMRGTNGSDSTIANQQTLMETS
jgi:hypothetical protein